MDRFGAPKLQRTGGSYIRNKYGKWVHCRVCVEIIADKISFEKYRSEVEASLRGVYEAAEDSFMDSEVADKIQIEEFKSNGKK